jgi:hypothetical protein
MCCRPNRTLQAQMRYIIQNQTGAQNIKLRRAGSGVFGPAHCKKPTASRPKAHCEQHPIVAHSGSLVILKRHFVIHINGPSMSEELERIWQLRRHNFGIRSGIGAVRLNNICVFDLCSCATCFFCECCILFLLQLLCCLQLSKYCLASFTNVFCVW